MLVHVPSDAGPDVSPKDKFITVYGRNPVLEALSDPDLSVDKVLIAEGARDVHRIRSAAASRDIPVRRVSAHRIKVLAGNGRHDQGVLADVRAPRMRPLDVAVRAGLGGGVLVLDAITNPANVGMILRTATAAGLDGVVLPRRGVPAIDPLVIKASAGVAFRAPVLRASTAVQACELLAQDGFEIVGLTGSTADGGPGGVWSVLDTAPPERAAFVLGNESTGISAELRPLVTSWATIPMAEGVESLNVASAAAVVCFEWARHRR